LKHEQLIMMQKQLKLLYSASVLIVSITACTAADQSTDRLALYSQKVEEVKMSQISEAVLAYDLSAAELAKAQGISVIPELKQLLGNEDAIVRVVVVTVLGEFSHPDAYALLQQAAVDEDDSVAVTAVDQLIKHKAEIGTAALIQILKTVKSAVTQRQLILVIGTMATPLETELLHVFCADNQFVENNPVCLAALSRLGLAKEQNDFSLYLQNKRDLEAFELAEYISQPWLLKSLGVLLRYTEPLQNLGDLPPGFPNMLRICDKAVVLIARISKTPLSFQTNMHMNYSNDQLQEAARVAGSSAGNR